MNKHFRLLILGMMLSTITTSGESLSLDQLKITDNLFFYRLNSSMGNTSSVLFTSDDGTLLIEPNFDQSESLIRDAMKRLSISKIDYVATSHVHRDHTEQYPAFLPEAIGIVPLTQRRELENETYLNGELPQLTYETRLHLYLGGEQIELSTLPNTFGHTGGDQLIYFKNSGVLYVGDYLFVDRYPIIDKNLGHLDGYLKNIEYIINNYPEDTQILGGHTSFHPAAFGAINMQDYQNYYTDLQSSISYIKKALQHGKTIDGIIEEGLPERFSKYRESPTYVNESRWIRYIAEHIK